MNTKNRRLWFYIMPLMLILATLNWIVLGYLGLLPLPWETESGPSISDQVKHILCDGRLADLPPSATDVKVHSWEGFFTGGHYLMFRASPEDIEKFLATSRSLTPTSKSLSQDPLAPDWFTLNTSAGRLFEIPANPKGHNCGSVAVDEESHVVYICVIWS